MGRRWTIVSLFPKIFINFRKFFLKFYNFYKIFLEMPFPCQNVLVAPWLTLAHAAMSSFKESGHRRVAERRKVAVAG